MIRITPQDIDKAIASADFQVFARRLTVCVLTLQNGYLVTGESSCNDPAEFDGAKGRAYALEQAREKVGALLAYAARIGKAFDTRDALAHLSREFVNDPGFAWSWHCNIAMAFQDAATDTFMAHDQARLSYVANDAAARFMKQAFGAQGYAPGPMRAEVKRDAAPEVAGVQYFGEKRAAALEINRAMTDACERVGTATPAARIRVGCVHTGGCRYATPCNGLCRDCSPGQRA